MERFIQTVHLSANLKLEIFCHASLAAGSAWSRRKYLFTRLDGIPFHLDLDHAQYKLRASSLGCARSCRDVVDITPNAKINFYVTHILALICCLAVEALWYSPDFVDTATVYQFYDAPEVTSYQVCWRSLLGQDTYCCTLCIISAIKYSWNIWNTSITGEHNSRDKGCLARTVTGKYDVYLVGFCVYRGCRLLSSSVLATRLLHIFLWYPRYDADVTARPVNCTSQHNDTHGGIFR